MKISIIFICKQGFTDLVGILMMLYFYINKLIDKFKFLSMYVQHNFKFQILILFLF